jgi:acetyl esterase/lipase
MTTTRTDHVYARRADADLLLTAHVDDAVAPRAVLLYLHGGGWRGGSRDAPNIATRLLPLTAGGVAVVSADYRLVPASRYPAQLEDAGDALEWVAEHFAGLPVFLAGSSAGGHLVALVGLGAWERLTGRVHRTAPAGVITYALVNDPLQYDGERRQAPRPLPGTFAAWSLERTGVWPPEELGAGLLAGADVSVSPIVTTHIGASAAATPFVLIVGDRDTCVRPDQTRTLYRALSDRGHEAHLVEIAGADHEDAAFDSAIVRGALLGFIERWSSAADERVPVGFRSL